MFCMNLILKLSLLKITYQIQIEKRGKLTVRLVGNANEKTDLLFTLFSHCDVVNCKPESKAVDFHISDTN